MNPKEAPADTLSTTATLDFLLANSQGLIVSLDGAGTLCEVAGNHNVLGYQTTELIGRNLRSLFNGIDYEAVDLNPQQADRPARQTWRLRHRLGFSVWTEAVVQFDPASQCHLLILRDISERMALEEQLALERDQARHADYNATDLISRHTMEGRYIFASAASQVLLGYTPGELFGRNFFDLIVPEDVESVRQAVDNIVDDSGRSTFTYRARHRNGTTVWFESRAQLSNHAQHPEQNNIVMVTRDITQLRQAQYRVRQQTRQMIALDEVGKAVTSTLDVKRILTLLVNKLAPMLHAQSAVIMLARHSRWEIAACAGMYAERYENASIKQSEPMFQAMLSTKQSTIVNDSQAETRRPAVDNMIGDPVPWRSYIFAPLLVNNATIGLIGGAHLKPNAFSLDDVNLLEAASNWAAIAIYNARLYQRAKRDRDRLRRLTSKAVEVLEAERADMAHELHDESGQSLTALRIHLSLIRDQVASLSAESAEQLNEALELTKQTMQRLSAIAKAMRPTSLDRVGLVSALESLCKEFSHSAKIPVTFTGTPVTLNDASKVTLYRFVQEALSNVGKHANATEVTVTVTTSTSQISVHIRDNGIGLESTDLAELGKGQALGLLGIRERLELLGGDLTVHSEGTGGTELAASVPIVPTPTAA